MRALFSNSKEPLRIAWPLLFQIFFGFVLSFLVFPGVLQSKPVSFIDSTEWNNLMIVGLFNVFDTVGRTLGGIDALMISSKRKFCLNFFALSRVLLVILPILVEVGIF